MHRFLLRAAVRSWRGKSSWRKDERQTQGALLWKPPHVWNWNTLAAACILASCIGYEQDHSRLEKGNWQIQLSSKTLCEEEEDRGRERRFQFFDKVLGEGSFGIVRLGRDQETGKRVAVKIVRHGRGVDVSNEIKAMQDVKSSGGHENVLHLIDVIEKPGVTMIITELVSGGEVFDRLVKNGPFSESDVAKMALSLAKGVDFLHTKCNLCHCDLKPENILFTSQDPSSSVKIVDFGSARRFNSRKQIVSDIGTTVYWAPENFSWSHKSQKESKESTLFGPAADMFAIGCILYICLFGIHPFDPDGNLEEHEIAERIQNGWWKFDDSRARISASAKSVIKGLLELDPRKRMTAAEMLAHPWVRGDTASRDIIDGSDSRLEEFQRARRKMKAGLLAAMIQQALQDQKSLDSDSLVIQVAKRDKDNAEQVLKRTFEFFDKDGKGYITPGDVSKGMADLGDEEFSSLDAGTIISAVNRRVNQHENSSDDDSSRSKKVSLRNLFKKTGLRRNGVEAGQALHFQDVVEILSEIPRKCFQDGDIVFRQDDTPDSFYFIMSGEVNVLVESSTGGGFVQTASLGPGNFFGEAGLLTGSPRSATIQCNGPVELLVLGKAEFEALKGEAAFNKTQASLNDLVVGRALGRLHSLFTSSPECTRVFVPRNQIVFEKGDPGEDVFVVNSGEVVLYENAEEQITKVSTGSMFGETALMTGKPRNASAVCASVEGCSLSRLPKEPFLRLMNEIDSAATMIRTRKSASFIRSEGNAARST